ncbi:hypothetical protein C8F04DRAFT_1362880 [Mycena alexandri]|uniref:Uncharacterized protein n=1 Tax=Mycena alexandri TaxID=1745969 RepID=A0AAD6X482_9AGAR|nr:hypothetical protein C8F04DRAFT_1362880 [Mycena alexandri]
MCRPHGWIDVGPAELGRTSLPPPTPYRPGIPAAPLALLAERTNDGATAAYPIPPTLLPEGPQREDQECGGRVAAAACGRSDLSIRCPRGDVPSTRGASDEQLLGTVGLVCEVCSWSCRSRAFSPPVSSSSSRRRYSLPRPHGNHARRHLIPRSSPWAPDADKAPDTPRHWAPDANNLKAPDTHCSSPWVPAAPNTQPLGTHADKAPIPTVRALGTRRRQGNPRPPGKRDK